MTLHGHSESRREDIRHVIVSSQRFLEPLTRSQRRECVGNLGRVDIYHVPCSTLNWDGLVDELNEGYVHREVSVVLGLTAGQYNGANRKDYVVGYCFDELVRRTSKISYDDDKHWREVALAHEMAHVWLDACYPIKGILDQNWIEQQAWKFHEGYEATAREFHVDY